MSALTLPIPPTAARRGVPPPRGARAPWQRWAGAGLLLGLLLAAACAPAANPVGGNRRVAAPPQTATAQAPATGERQSSTAALPGGFSSGVLGLVYQTILDRYVDRVDHTRLLDAARQVLGREVKAQGVLPLFSLPIEVQPAYSGDPGRDWSAFSAGYDALVQKLPDWTNQAHPDRLVIQAMVDSLDDSHTAYLSPEEARARRETSYAGVGIRLARGEAGQPPLVKDVFNRGPAQIAGMKPGDRIVAVDGQDLANRPAPDAVQLIRGKPGSSVTLTVRRRDAPGTLEFRITRAVVQLESALGGAFPALPIGYLRINSFAEDTAARVQAILQAGKQSNLRGWVVDLRGNPGGLLVAVQQVAGGFMDIRPIGFEVNREGQRRAILSEGTPIAAGLPVAVLIDGESSSGAEILASALREYGIAQLVGAGTAGRVGVSTPISLPDGSELQVTEKRYVSRSGQQIDRVGIQPDLAVDLSSEDIETNQDPPLVRAIQVVVDQLKG